MSAGAGNIAGMLPGRLAHSGESMAPTLRDGDVLALESAAPAAIRPGDVIAFARADGPAAIVHRVVARAADGFVTRGDGARERDPGIVGHELLLGRVAGAWRGRRQVAVHGGARGLAQAGLARGRARLCGAASRCLAPWPRLLPESGWAAPLLPAALRPRVVAFAGGRGERRLLIGAIVAGRYDSARGAWRVRLLFRPFVRASALSRISAP